MVIWFIEGTQRVAVGLAGSAAPSQWEIAGIANFDGLASTLTPTDDILWRRNGGQTVIWLQNGAQRIGAGSPGSIGAVWNIEDTGDFDGDGNADILWSIPAASCRASSTRPWGTMPRGRTARSTPYAPYRSRR